MDATLTISADAYHLDWNGNSLTDKPVLVVNGETGKQWSLIDILLDIFRHLPQKPSAVFVPPSSNAKEKVLKMFHSWGADIPHRKDHLFVYLDGHLLAIETHNTSDLKMGTCRVININYEQGGYMFIAYVKQVGEGCDYTIGCAQTLWRLKANTRDEAIEELKQMVYGEWLPEYGEYEGGCWDERGEGDLSKVELFEVISSEQMPIELWYAEGQEQIERGKIEVARQKEKMEYDRLKMKYES